MILARIVLLMACATSLIHAQDLRFSGNKWYRVENFREKLTRIDLTFSPSELVVTERPARKVNVRIAYTSIREASYELVVRSKADRLLDYFSTIPAPFPAQSHWLEIQTTDGPTIDLILLLNTKNRQSILDALAARTGKAIRRLSPAESRMNPPVGRMDAQSMVAEGPTPILAALREAMAQYACKVERESPNKVECRRPQALLPGVSGGGGELIIAELTPSIGGTDLQLTTKPNRLGLLGMTTSTAKNWSEPILAATLARLSNPLLK